jgi:hypothetical protein
MIFQAVISSGVSMSPRTDIHVHKDNGLAEIGVTAPQSDHPTLRRGRTRSAYSRMRATMAALRRSLCVVAVVSDFAAD